MTKCEDTKCICLKSDDFLNAFKESNKQTSNIFFLKHNIFKKIKNFLRDGTIPFS